MRSFLLVAQDGQSRPVQLGQAGVVTGWRPGREESQGLNMPGPVLSGPGLSSTPGTTYTTDARVAAIRGARRKPGRSRLEERPRLCNREHRRDRVYGTRAVSRERIKLGTIEG